MQEFIADTTKGLFSTAEAEKIIMVHMSDYQNIWSNIIINYLGWTFERNYSQSALSS